MSSNTSSKSSGDFPITITARDVGIDQTIGKLTRFADVIKTLDAQFKASMTSMTAYNNMFTTFGRNFTTLNAGFNQGAAGAQKFDSAIRQNVNTLRSGQTTLTQYMNTQRQSAQSSQQASAAQTTLSNSNQRYNQTLQQTVSTNQTAVNSQNTLNQSRMRTMMTMRDLNSMITRYNAGNANLVSSTNQAADATDNATGGYNRIGEAIGGAFQKGMNLFLSFTMLRMAMQESVGMQEMLASQQEKVNQLTVAADEAIKQYGEDSKEATRAEKQRDDALRGLSYTQRNANMAAGDASFFIIMMATNILGSLIPALTKWKETSESVKRGWDVLTTALDGLKAKILAKAAATTADTAAEATNTAVTNAGTTAKIRATAANVASSIAHRTSAISAGGHSISLGILTAMTTAVTGAFVRFFTVLAGGALGVATGMVNLLTAAMGRLRIAIMANLAVLGPIAIAIVAIGLALAAISTDFMGVRTRMQEFGASVSEQIPILYPFGEALQGIGATLGLTGESAEEASQHFKNATTGFEEMGELWNRTIGELQESSNKFVRAIGDTAAVLTTDFRQAQSDFQAQLKATSQTWSQFVDALSKGDFERALDIIISSLSALPGIIINVFSHLGTQIYDTIVGGLNVLSALGEELKPYFESAWNAIVGLATAAGTRIFNELVKGLAPIIGWVQNSIVVPIQNFFNGIASGLQNIADAILRALGLTNLPQAALVLANSIGKGIMKIVDYASDIADSLWSKLQLNGLVKKATDLAKDIWNAITGFFDSASAESANNVTEGTPSLLTDEQVADIDKTNQQKVKDLQDRLARGEKIPGYNTAPTLDTTTAVNSIQPSSVTSSAQNDFSKMQQAFKPIPTPGPQQQQQQQVADISKDVISPEPTVITPSNTGLGTKTPSTTTKNPYAMDFSKPIPKFNSGGGTADFIAGQQQPEGSQIVTQADKQKTALAELRKSYDSMQDTQKEAAQSGLAFLESQKSINPELLNNSAALHSIVDSISPVIDGNSALSKTLNDNSVALANNYLQGELQKKGHLEQRKVLQDMQMQVETNRGSLEEYADQVEEGTILNYAFTLGQQDQRKALLDSQVEVANTNGMLQEYALQLEEGKIQQVAFTQGQQEVVKQFMDTVVETENLNGQYTLLKEALNSTGAAQVMYNNGFAKGRVETAQQIIAIDQLRGSYDGTREVLMETAADMNLFADATIMSNEQLMRFIEVVKGAPEALSDLGNWFGELGQSIVDNLAGALREGGDEFDDALEEIEDRLNTEFSDPVKLTLEMAANTENLKEDIMQGLGVMSVLIAAKADPSQIQEVGKSIINTIKENVDETTPNLTASFDNIMSKIKIIMSQDIGTPAFNKALVELRTELENIGVPAATVEGIMSKLGGSTTSATAGANGLAGGLNAVGQGAAAADPELQKMITSIERLNTIDSTATQIFTVNIPGYVTTMATAIVAAFVASQMGSIQSLNTIDSTATQVFVTNIPSYPVNVSNAVAEHFGKAADDGISLMEALDSGVSQSFENMAEYPSLVSEAVDQEFGKAADDGTNLIQALERAVEQSANAMADSLGKVAEAIDAIGESAQNAESDVDSLRNAVESLPDIHREIVYEIKTVGSKPDGAGQFGLNATVNKPSLFLAGEGWGKERVKIQPGTMPFMEDFRTEMNQKFEVQRQAQNPQQQQQQQQTDPNVYAPGYEHTNQTNNPDLGGTSGRGMMISNNASLIQMNNGNGKRMIVDGKTGTVIMLDGSASASDSNTNTNTNTNTGGNGNTNTGTGNSYTDENGNNYNYDNDSNSQNNVYAPGYTHNTTPPATTPPPASSGGGNGNGVNQTQTNNQSGSGQNYYYQSQTNNGQTSVNTNMGSMPQVSPGLINQSSSSSGSTPVSGSYSVDSRSRLLSRGDPFGFQTRVVHETPIEVNIDLEGVRIARKILKILTEEMGFGSGYYG